MIARVLYLVLVGGGFGATIWWLARYSSNMINANSSAHSISGELPGTGKSKDTTVSAYARQVHEHDLLLDDQTDAAMSTAKPRPDVIEQEITITEERTSG